MTKSSFSDSSGSSDRSGREDTPGFTQAERGRILLATARVAISKKLGIEVAGPVSEDPWFQQLGACFVTLHIYGDLRGCIGTLEAKRPLIDEVAASGRAAAFEDPRFPPLTLSELPRVLIEVSVLSPPEPLEFASQEELRAILRPGIDGLVLKDGANRSTFLPQVWENLPSKDDFLAQLKKKAGLSIDHWSETIAFERYTVEIWSEG